MSISSGDGLPTPRVAVERVHVAPSTTVRELIERADAHGWSRVEYDVEQRAFYAHRRANDGD